MAISDGFFIRLFKFPAIKGHVWGHRGIRSTTVTTGKPHNGPNTRSSRGKLNSLSRRLSALQIWSCPPARAQTLACSSAARHRQQGRAPVIFQAYYAQRGSEIVNSLDLLAHGVCRENAGVRPQFCLPRHLSRGPHSTRCVYCALCRAAELPHLERPLLLAHSLQCIRVSGHPRMPSRSSTVLQTKRSGGVRVASDDHVTVLNLSAIQQHAASDVDARCLFKVFIGLVQETKPAETHGLVKRNRRGSTVVHAKVLQQNGTCSRSINRPVSCR